MFKGQYSTFIGTRSHYVIFRKLSWCKSADRPGRQHIMDKEYFARIEAMHYAIAHDDGQGLWNLEEADVIIIGVSRTSKTPTCIYLANRGLKAANIPFVPNIEFPKELQQFNNKTPTKAQKKPLIIGLTKDPKSLVQVRKNRLRMIAEQEETNYTDIETVKNELANCRKLCTKNGWPIINVSRRSIEETRLHNTLHEKLNLLNCAFLICMRPVLMKSLLGIFDECKCRKTDFSFK